MNSKTLKRQRDLKNKLMAAISMLLVSSIMLVTSTYAWFTLSTAPEVTGITTAVGANGNLEMALLPTDGLTKSAVEDYGITANVGDSGLDASVKNITWGNLVDLSDDSFYGLDKLTLNPSALHVATWDDDTTKLNPTKIVTATILSTPTYGADGRVSSMADNTTTSTYVPSSSSFPQNTFNGVRAVGTASGMTDRQLAYRNYRSSASTAMAQAKNVASQSLNTNGAALADIAIAHGVDASAKHSDNDVFALLAIVDDLLGKEGKTGVLQYIEKSYKDYIIAYAASAANASMDDTAFNAFQNAIEDKDTLEEVQTYLSDKGITFETPISTAMSKLIATKAKVTEAKTALTALTSETEDDDVKHIEWASLSTPLSKLADTSAMKINGYAASTVKEHIGDIASNMSNGLVVTISSNGGVYADVADHCGDYNAQIVIKEIAYGDIELTDVKARMQTDTTVDDTYHDVYLGLLNAVVTNAGEPAGTGQTMPITDYFGYIIDLAFKTNAAESNLLLQTTPVDRIYDQDGNEDTMGHGATMTFTSTTTDFTAVQLAELMDAIRIVFFEPVTGDVCATAKLDMAENAYTVVGGNTITANIYLYENADSATTYRLATAGETATHVAVPNYRTPEGAEVPTYIEDESAENGYRLATEEETATHVLGSPTYREKTGDETATHIAEIVAGGSVMVKDQKDAVITALTQNTAKAVSVLVYLDGNYVTNADVAATAGTSMTGSMNLQFASSANLTPMNYTPLMEQTGNSNESGTTYNVTIPTGVTGDATATAGEDYTFTVNTGYTLGTVTVGDTTVTPTDNGSGAYTIPAASVTGAIVINVTTTT